MDIGGVHNETDNEGDEDDEDENVNHGLSAMNGGQADHSMAGGGRSHNNQYHHRQAIEDDQIGDVEDGSRGEEGGCRESTYMEEEIEQSISGNLGGHHQSQDAPELGVHPQSSSAKPGA